MDPKRLEAKASLSRAKGRKHMDSLRPWSHASVLIYLVAKGRKHSGHWRCACVNLGANVDKMELSSGKKRWSLRSQAIIATNGKYKALICAAFASCTVEKKVSLLNAGTKENSPEMQRCSAEKCRSKAKP